MFITEEPIRRKERKQEWAERDPLYCGLDLRKSLPGVGSSKA